MNELVTLTPALILAVAALLPAHRWALLATAVASAVAFLASVIVVLTGVPSPLTRLVLLYTTGVVAVLAVFSRRHLDGDVRAAQYSRAFLLAAASALVVVASGNLLVIAVAWVATGRALAVLLGHHDRVNATADAVRRLWRARLASDAALVIASLTLVGASGESSVAAVSVWAAANPTALALPVATVALFVAAAARSGLWPFSRWLVQSVVAPAPVSALLHAGIVNAPVVLLLTLQPVWTLTTGADVLLAVVGFGSAIVLFPRKLVRPDVKTRLAWSTCAQLGFMLGLVAIGAPLAAIAHMVLHGTYKAAAFLGAGEQISKARAAEPASIEASTAPMRAIGMVAGLLTGAGFATVVGAWSQPVTSVTLV
ncbi:MAG: hypothetical protein LH630_10655, partial [Actinomycetia bacterium]|nr:hypothetical protein [Actinomycetes bacterium]